MNANIINQTYRNFAGFRRAAWLIAALTAGAQTLAQEPGKKQTIDITSSFKPVLRNAAKINFNASPPRPDSGKPRLAYQVPVQNLVPGLVPVSIRPLALQIDSAAPWANSNYLKAGFGNLSTPYAEAGLSLGSQKSRVNILASYISSNGPIENQDYSQTSLAGHFYTPIAPNLELSGKLAYQQDRFFQFGYDQAKYSFEREDLLNRYNTITAKAGLRNLSPTEYGLNYNPSLSYTIFNDQRSNNESTAELDLPLEKVIGEALSLSIGFNANMTRFSPSNADVINNNLYQFPVTVQFRTPNLRFQAASTPAWDNGTFHFLPNFWVDFPIAQEKWVVQAGWISYFNKGTYQSFASMNPYIAVPERLRNNRMVERYVGFKGTLFQNFTYNAKLGSAQFNGVPLFVNDTASGKSFEILFEDKLEAFQLQAELGYVKGESFTLKAGFNFYSFNEQKTEDKAYGLIPVELNAHLRWLIMKDLWFRSDLYMWQGPLYKLKNGNFDRLGGAVDLNAGIEFRVMKNLMLWAQFNNITNSSYQRWHQYQAYGFNMLAGATLSFNQ
jgi:hypothetical protein